MKEAKGRRLERGWKEVGKVTSARETGNKAACLPRTPAAPDSRRGALGAWQAVWRLRGAGLPG